MMKVFTCYYLISFLAIHPDGYGIPPKSERRLKIVLRLWNGGNHIGRMSVSGDVRV